jgi:hypothetical protein
MPTDTLTPAVATVGTVVAAQASNAAVSVDLKIIFITRILFLRSHRGSKMLTECPKPICSFFAKAQRLQRKGKARWA